LEPRRTSRHRPLPLLSFIGSELGVGGSLSLLRQCQGAGIARPSGIGSGHPRAFRRTRASIWRRLVRSAALTILLVGLGASSARSQEVTIGLGRLHGIGYEDMTYSWQFQYLSPVRGGWAGSIGWLNEGHIPDHHRDGPYIQVWRLHRMKGNDLRLGLGMGAYRYFDTTEGGAGPAFQNHHGIKPLFSLSAQYPLPGGGAEAFVLINRTFGSGLPQTQALLVGVSIPFKPRDPAARLDAPTPKGRREGLSDPDNELTIFLGRTILNSFESEATDLLGATAVEYRRRLGSQVDMSIGYFDEGGLDSVRRDGIAAQAWFSQRSADGRWLIGFGAGPYFSRDFPEMERRNSGSSVTIRTSTRYSVVVGRHVWDHWAGRLEWNRTLTRYHRDTDVLMMGLAYQW